MLVPLQKNIIEIDTSNTTQFDGEYSFLYRGANCMKVVEVDMNVKIKVDAFNFVYGVNGGRRFYKVQTKWLNKYKPLIGDIITNHTYAIDMPHKNSDPTTLILKDVFKHGNT